MGLTRVLVPATEGRQFYLPVGTARRVMLGFHGRSGTYLTPANFETPEGYTELARRHGFATVTADWGGPTNWGRPSTTPALVDAAIAALATRGHTAATYDIYAGSMGASAACAWIRDNPTKVRSVTFIAPGVNVARLHDTGGFEAEIDTAWGGDAAYDAAIATDDPMVYASEFQPHAGKVWYSNGDTTVLPADAMTFATAAGFEQRAIAGDPIHANAIPPFSEVLEFLQRT